MNVNKRIIIISAIAVLTILIPQAVLFAGGASEESSSGSVRFQADQGIISRPDEVIASSFISSIDYNYPEPDGNFGVYLYSGNREVPASGGVQVFVAGIQSARLSMADLPPMNLCFVIDNSGSMEGEAKMEWVWDSFDIFIETVRETDFVSVVRFDSTAEVLFPSTRMENFETRKKVQDIVRSIQPAGGTNLYAGLELGYQQVMMNFRKEYVNRVLFLTDGQGGSEGMLETAAAYRDMGINVSTIGLGTGFNGELLRSVAKTGGGTSRFVSDRERMLEIFGTGLSRMIVPVVSDLELELELPGESRITGVWAYDYKTEMNKVLCSYPNLHVGDYETIIIQADLPPLPETNTFTALRVTGRYTDSSGNQREMPDKSLNLEISEEGGTTDGFSDAVVLRSGTALRFAEALKEIGRLYYTEDGLPVSEETADYMGRIEEAIKIANSMKKELYSAGERLESAGFQEEIEILEKYLRILGGRAEYTEEHVKKVVSDREPEVKVTEYSFTDRVSSLFRELMLTLKDQHPGALVISGFSFKDDRESPILDFLGNYAVSSFSGSETFPLVSREDLDKIMEEQKLTLSGLFETETAISVGELLSAKYMITGTVIEMNASVIIFTRIINIETSQIIGASQIIVNKDTNVTSLL